MDSKIIIGAALLGGFIIYKTNKPKNGDLGKKEILESTIAPPTIAPTDVPTIAPTDAPSPQEENIEIVQADSLSDDEKKKIIESVKNETNFQKGKLFAVEIGTAIIFLSAGVAYLIKLLLDRYLGRDFGKAGEILSKSKSLNETLLPKINEVNVDFEGSDFSGITANKSQQKTFAQRFNKSFRSFKKAISNKIENFKDYMDPYRFKKQSVEKVKSNVVKQINKVTSVTKQNEFMDRYNKIANNPRKPENMDLSTKEGKNKAYEETLDNLYEDLGQLIEDIIDEIQKEREMSNKTLFSDLEPKSNVIFFGSNPLEQFHQVLPSSEEIKQPVYLSDFEESQIYEQMQFESILYSIVYDSLNDVTIIKTMEKGEKEENKPPPETGFTEIKPGSKTVIFEKTDNTRTLLLQKIKDLDNELFLLMSSLKNKNVNTTQSQINDQLSSFKEQLKKMINDPESIIDKETVEQLSEKIKNFLSDNLNEFEKFRQESTSIQGFNTYISNLSDITQKDYLKEN